MKSLNNAKKNMLLLKFYFWGNIHGISILDKDLADTDRKE